MPTDNTNTSTDTSSTDETSGQEQQGQQQQTTGETPGNGEQQQQASNTPEAPITLPDDHPLVKTLATQKDKIKTAQVELTELRSKSAKVTQLEDELKARPSQEAVDTLQTRYDRLEAFLQAAGGPLGKALDSRSFTKALFETETDITDLVKDWHKANPSATSAALGSAGAQPDGKKSNMSDLLRAAAK